MLDTDKRPQRIAGFADLAAAYDGLLCDIWGVVHNGVAAHRPAVDALRRYRAGGGCVVLVSNAPRPAGEVRKQLFALGVSADAFDAVITSGDITRSLIAERDGKTFFHLGPERDVAVFAGFEQALAPAGSADFVLCTGLLDDTSETPDDYRDLFSGLVERGVEMVCANPDLVVERGGALVYCAGSLAQAYEHMGGRVVYAGKPHRPIYDMALAMLAEARGADIVRARVLAVGDSIRTDLRGAREAGLDALFIVGGIHAGELGGDAAARMFAEAGVMPRYVMDALGW